MFSLGYFKVKEKNVQFKPDLEKGYVAISNHICAMDPVCLISRGFVSFVAKEEIKKFPFFGFGTWIGQGIFVQRDNKKQCEKTALEIQNRICNDV